MKPHRFAPLDADDAAYLLQNIASFEPDWLLCLPFIPPAERSAALAILAFAAEILTIPARISNPIMGQIRVEWWREAVQEITSAAAMPRRHPLVQALRATLPSPSAKVGSLLREALDGLAPFLDHGTDEIFPSALEVRLVVYRPLIQLAVGDENAALIAQVLTLHGMVTSLKRSATHAPAEGQESPQARFIRSAQSQPQLKEALYEAITAYRDHQHTPEDFHPLSLPLSLVRIRQGSIQYRTHPLAQRWACLKAALTGRV